MAKIDNKIDIEITKVYLVFFPIATFKKCGDVEMLTLFAIPVYRRVGYIKNILHFITWGKNAS